MIHFIRKNVDKGNMFVLKIAGILLIDDLFKGRIVEGEAVAITTE